MNYIKILTICTSILNLLGTVCVLIGSWKMIFSSKPAINVLLKGDDNAPTLKLTTIAKWFLGKTSLVSQFAEKYESVTVPKVLEQTLRYLIGGVVLQLAANILFFILSVSVKS